MAKMERKSFDNPEETRSIEKGKIEVVKLGEVTAMRVRFEPGWRWSECVKPVAGTPSCQVGHLMHVVSGRMGVRMDDGSEVEFGPGDVGTIPPGTLLMRPTNCAARNALITSRNDVGPGSNTHNTAAASAQSTIDNAN